MSHLSLSFLGPFQAWTADGTLQPFRTLKERALLAYLTVESNEAHRRETLALLFWPDRPEGIARNNLRQAMFGIRQGIGEAAFDRIFTVSNEEVRVNIQDQVWLDVAAFELHLKAVSLHNHEGSGFCSYCTQHLRDAVEIYRGNFLEDVLLEKNHEFQEWVEVQRDQYFRMQMQALDALVNAYERAGNYMQAITYARRCVQMDDLKEHLYRQLMILLAKTGQANMALEAYETCRRKIKENMGRDLDEQTVELGVQIRSGHFDSSKAARAIFHNLPEQLTPFIGREMELIQITNALESPACRLVSLVGLGGVGKTRLAIQAAYMNLRRFSDGVYFIPLDTIQSSGPLSDIIGRVIGLAPGANQDMSQLVIDYLRQMQALLVLDEFEHFVDRTDQLLDLLHQVPGIKILLTTRERLRVQAECLIELQGLTFPKVMGKETDLKSIETQVVRSDAIRLFFERAHRVRLSSLGERVPAVQQEGDSAISIESQHELESALRICELVDGLPLGIELAASWAHEYSYEQIADEIKRSLEFLQNSLQDLPERHRSLQASFEHSWDLLSENECEVFSKLAVFPGSFSRQAAQEVAGAAQPWLIRLEDKSLVRRAGFGRYTLHPLLRQYAGQKLRQYSRKTGELAQQAHAEFYCSLMKSRELDLRGFQQIDALNELEMDLENIATAWDWAIEHRAYHLIERASIGMLFFLEERSQWQEGEARFRSALESLQIHENSEIIRRVRAYLYLGLGWFCCRITRFQESEQFLQLSLQACEELEVPFVRAFSHFALGFLYVWMSRFKDAWLHLSYSLSLAENSGDGWGLAWSHEILAEMAFESGKTGLDDKPFLETLSLFERVGEQRGSSRALNYLGNIAMARGRYADARLYFEKLLAIAEKLGDVWGIASGYGKLGQVAAASGEYEHAWRLHQRSLSILLKTGDQRRTAYAMRDLGEVSAALEEREDATGYFQQALEIAARSQSISLIQDILTGIAGVQFKGNEKERAVELLSVVRQEPIGDKLTAERADRLWELMNTDLTPELLEAARANVDHRSIQEIVDRLLLEGIRL